MSFSSPSASAQSFPRIAITGGIGEGKSTLLRMIEEEGHEVASADLVARELFADPAVNARLASLVGHGGAITPLELREALGRRPDVRRGVNRLMHPLVFERLLAGSARFIEVPLLFETCTQHYFDRVWVVTCGPAIQRRRLLERYRDANTVSALLASQLPTKAKLVFADQIFRTNLPFNHVKRLLSEALAGLQA